MSYIVEYYKGNEKEWDDFILNKSINGTFLQTRNFINYHKEGKFKDCSLCIRKGTELVACILACEIIDEGKKTFFAHKGTTFGGITLLDRVYNASNVNDIFDDIYAFLKQEGFEKIYIKMVPNIYCKKDIDLLDYFFYNKKYKCYCELNYYLNLDEYTEDIPARFSSSKRRDYKYSLNNNLSFKELETKEDISLFYDVLLSTLNKLGLNPVHSLDDLYDIYFNRQNNNTKFYGVFLENQMIAGSMDFIFDNRIFHTQYLCSKEEYLKLFPMDFLITNLINEAKKMNMEKFTFGICTEDQGRYLNLGLSRFKEGFGTHYIVNKSYELEVSDGE